MAKYLLAFCLLGGPVPAAETSDPTGSEDPVKLAEVMSSWQLREAAANSVRLEWIEQQTTDISGVRLPDAAAQAELGSQREITRRTRFAALFDGRRVRITEEPADPEHEQNRRTMVFDGQTGKGLIDRTSLNYPEGAISEIQIPNRNVATYIPLLVSFRLLDEHMRPFDEDNFRLSDEPGVVDGRPCLVVDVTASSEANESKTLRRLYVDPEREFVIVRYERLRSGAVRSRTTFSHVEVERFGWVPMGWRLETIRPDGSIHTSIVAEVVECDLDPEIADADFELEFPVGTRYSDNRDGQRRRLIVQTPGKSREFFPPEIERGATQEDLLSTEAGQAKLPLTRQRNPLLWLNAAAAAALTAVLIWIGLKKLLSHRNN